MSRLLGALGLFFLAWPCAAEGPITFHFQKEILPGVVEDDSPIVAVILDSQIYFTASEGFPDLRVFDGQGAEIPFLLEKATAAQHDTVRATRPGEGDHKSEYPIVEFARTDREMEKHTVIVLTTQREPLTSFTIETASRNFSREATVEVPVEVPFERGVDIDWQEIGRATLSMEDTGALNREELVIAFPERRQAQYRIVIDNRDKRPLRITNVRAWGSVYRMVFSTPETEACRVYYGSDIAERPNYETADALVWSRKDYLAREVQLGPETVNPTFGKRPRLSVGKLPGSGIILGAAICAVVVGVSWVLFRARRRIDRISADETSE